MITCIGLIISEIIGHQVLLKPAVVVFSINLLVLIFTPSKKRFSIDFSDNQKLITFSFIACIVLEAIFMTVHSINQIKMQFYLNLTTYTFIIFVFGMWEYNNWKYLKSAK
jgi:hypothetical protein